MNIKMPELRIATEMRDAAYFITMIVRNWQYVFDRHYRFSILRDAILHYQKHNGLKIYAYVFMINHLHLIATAPDMIAFVRDFKKYIAREMQKSIIAHEPRRLCLFQPDLQKFEFWEKGNKPKLIETEEFLYQKINYIHQNPVRKQYAREPEQWAWSSANPDSEIQISHPE